MNENFAAFLGDEVASKYLNGNLVITEPAEPQLITDALMSRAEAEAKDKLIIRSVSELGNHLVEMRSREGWRALGYSSMEAYLAVVSKKTELSRKTLFRRMQVSRVNSNLCQSDTNGRISTKNITSTQKVLLAKLPDDAQIQAVTRAKELALEYEPEGRAAEFHFPGKMLTRHIEQAVEEIRKEIDPFADEEGEEEETPATVPMKQGRKDFFSEQNRGKPLPPQDAPTDAQEDSTEDIEPTRLSYLALTRYTGNEGDFLCIVGTDGYDDYEILVRVEDVKRMLK